MTKKNILSFTAVMFLVILLTSTFSLGHVSGHSMDPTFDDGDYVLIMNKKAPSDNDVVILDTSKIAKFDHDVPELIKRYYKDKSTNGYYILGDNSAASYDSRYFGEVEKDSYEGSVILNITKAQKNMLLTITNLFK